MALVGTLTSAALAAAVLGCAPASGGEPGSLPAPPGLDPAAVGRRSVATVFGAVVASSPDENGRPCPTALRDPNGDGSIRPLAWEAGAPPWNEWQPGSVAVCALDSLGRLVAALPDREGARPVLAAARIPSTRFTDRELAWAYAAVLRHPNPESLWSEVADRTQAERERWMEFALRFVPSGSGLDRVPLADVPTDLLRVAFAAGSERWRGRNVVRIGRELLRRGETLDLAPLRDAGSRGGRGTVPQDLLGLFLAAGDADARADVLDSLQNRGADPTLRAIVAAGFREDPELRAALAPHVRSGSVPALTAWLECGGSARELLDLQPGSPVVLDDGHATGAAKAEWMEVAAARTANSPPDGLLWAARIARDVPAADRAAVLASFGGVGVLEDAGSEALRLAIRTRLGDGDAAALLARVDWTTIERGEDRRTIAFLRLLARSRGPDATAALARFLLMPEQSRRESGCGNRNDDDARREAVASLDGRDEAERAAGLRAIDDLGVPRGGFEQLVLGLRWRFGAPPDAATLHRVFRGSSGSVGATLPRGAWGADEAALRTELLARNDWAAFLALDGSIPAEIVDRALEELSGAVAPKRGGPPAVRDPLSVVTIARPAGAVGVLRDLLAAEPRERSETWAAIGALTPASELASLAEEMLRRTADTPPDRRPSSWVAHGFLAALVEGAH